MEKEEVFHVPKDHIFLVSWGCSGVRKALDNYISEEGRCVIIIGEDGYLVKQANWKVELIEIPNFQLVQTKMSINLRE